MNKNFRIVISLVAIAIILIFGFILFWIYNPLYNPFCKSEGESVHIGSWSSRIFILRTIISIFFPNQKCCAGLTKIDLGSPIIMPDGSLDDCIWPVGGGVAYICTKCGNGICEKRENKCNCPQDCK